jgi:uncharacterized phage protein gp47/JayE
MAEFTPRTFDQILNEMIASVQSNTDISDFSVGSAVRTILEAAAAEDDEQYFQMTQILSIFSIFTARGVKLERRLADFGISRNLAKQATGRVKFFDSSLIGGTAALDSSVAATTITLFDSNLLPVSGYPYDIRIAESTSRTTNITVTNNNTNTGVLTLGSGLPFQVLVGDRVSLVTGAVARVINAGQTIQNPATQSSAAKLYATTEQAFITAGNFYSNEVSVKSTIAGSAGNATSSQVRQFVGNPPFTGAGLVSITNMAGGRDIETDEDLVKRAIEQITSLSRGTVLAVKSAAKGVEDLTTGQRVLSSNLVEDFLNNEVIVYIDDGTGFIPDYTSLPENNITGGSSAGDLSILLVDGSNFSSSGNILIVDGADSELLEYVTKPTANSLFLNTATSDAHTAGTPVIFVDILSTSTELNQKRFRFSNFPVVRNTEVIYKLEPAGDWTQLVRNIDYVINKGTGHIILVTALPATSQLVANYDYYINLAATVQKVLEGDPNDEINFPGVKAAGINLSVEAPTIRRITVQASISAKPGFVETDLYDDVRIKIEQYITSLGLGEDVIISRIIDAAHDNAGVASVRISIPEQDVVILENELPVPFDSSGDSLVSVI